MHIGIDARMPSYRTGGITQYVLLLIKSLSAIDSKNRYTVFHSRKARESFLPDARNFARRSLWTPPHHRFEKWLLASELMPHRTDVFHSPDFIPPTGGAGRRVITVHDLNFIHFPQLLTRESRRYYLDQIEWAVGVADHILADSDHTRRDLIQLMNVSPEKVTRVYLAANPIYQCAVARERSHRLLQKHRLEAGYILFVGTLEPRKNVPFLLRAFVEYLARAKNRRQLVLAGGRGWLYDEIFGEIAGLELTREVVHIEELSDEELSALYRSAGLLALPSLYEGFGLPVLEAMHCDCPVIASDRGSLPEVVGDAGILLPPDAPEEWAGAMDRVLSDRRLREEMTAAGQKQAARFSWETTARETLAVYEATS
jgi:glycosyltransferase involved in cell wall biosynthesis